MPQHRLSSGAPARMAVVVATAAWGLACGASEEPLREAAARALPASESQLRVVSLAPAASAFALRLDVGSILVGVDAESHQRPALAGLPLVDWGNVASLAPDLVIVPELGAEDERRAAELRNMGLEVVEFAPHDLRDAFDLCRGLGARLAGPVRAGAFENGIARELAEISGASFGRPRPRVLAVISVDPLVLAAGHSFITDLLEIAGASSLTHDHEGELLVSDGAGFAGGVPDLVLFVGASELSEAERAAIAPLLPPAARTAFFAFTPQRFWIEDAPSTARRLRTLIEPVSHELE